MRCEATRQIKCVVKQVFQAEAAFELNTTILREFYIYTASIKIN